MKQFTDINDPQVTSYLAAGSVGVVRTDTLYGVVARSSDSDAVARVFEVKRRSPLKQLIVLIADQSQLYDEIPEAARGFVSSVWPGPVSLALPSSKAPAWLLAEGNSIAYRLPADESLRTLIRQTGPLVAPSANPEGSPPAKTINEAVAYFGESVDFYVDGGEVVDDSPSQLYAVDDSGSATRLR